MSYGTGGSSLINTNLSSSLINTNLSNCTTNLASSNGSMYITSSNASTATGTTFATQGGSTVVFTSGGNQLVVNGGCSLSDTLIELLADQRVEIDGQLFDTNGRLLKVKKGMACTIQLPDGSCVFIQADGSYEIRHTDNTVVRRKPIRLLEFNRFINASDLLEEFIKDLGVCGVKQDEVLNIPIELFINWLVIRAAEQDGEEPPEDIPKLETVAKYKPPQCKTCGRFISKRRKEAGMLFCNSEHFKRYEDNLGLYS